MNDFERAVVYYRRTIGELNPSPTRSLLRMELHVECLKDWSRVATLEEVRAWFMRRRQICTMSVNDISLAECRGWHVDPLTGWFHHDSGRFFLVQGIRTSHADFRESGKGWDQPILTQVGLDGGILGIIRKRIEGVPHYLIEAKTEPGNYERVQLSPTVQATFSNLQRAHGGRKPHFSEYFLEPASHGAIVHYDNWLSEDGGRLNRKRNKGMLIELPEESVLEHDQSFKWMSMWQIKECLHENAWVGPHIRGIIAHL
jgi:dTDP-4-dehydro-6-deoxy-alpha-D-glucopyranose 2,3-dehydratase